MAVQCGGQACQRTSISGLAILLSQAGHIRPGQPGPVAGHSFRPPAMARVVPGASKTMLLQEFSPLDENILCLTFGQIEMDSEALEFPIVGIV